MSKVRITTVTLIIAILFVSSLGYVIVYYDGKIDALNSKISMLNRTIDSFPKPNLTASLSVDEMLGNNSNAMGTPTPIPYNYLYITGSINNTGQGTAYNAGLNVIAFSANGIVEVNMTVPLSSEYFQNGIFGTDNATNTFISSKYGSSSLSLGVLDGKQTAYLGSISIVHEGLVTNWTVTPVWTNTP